MKTAIEAAPGKVKVDFAKDGRYEIYLLDKEHDGTLVKTTEDLTFTSCIMIKEI